MEQGKLMEFKKLNLEDKLTVIYSLLWDTTSERRDIDNNKLVSFTNAARMLGVSYQTIHNWVAKQNECDYEADGSRFMLSYGNLKQVAQNHNKVIDRNRAEFNF